jgi:FkbM family methyltransferase
LPNEFTLRELQETYEAIIGKKFDRRNFRKSMISNNIINKNKNIIDLGAWIGDNSISWAKLTNGEVYAIEASIINIEFIKEIKKINKISNITVINKLVSDNVSVFNDVNSVFSNQSYLDEKTSNGNGKTSTTLDILESNNIITNIGFIHLDVEGMEYLVLKGSTNIIKKYKPIISIECHSQKEIIQVKNLLRKFKYSIYLIDEVCGITSSCRNFIMTPSNLKLDIFEKYKAKIYNIDMECIKVI